MLQFPIPESEEETIGVFPGIVGKKFTSGSTPFENVNEPSPLSVKVGLIEETI